MKVYSLLLLGLSLIFLTGCKSDIDVFETNYTLEITNAKARWSTKDKVQLQLQDQASMGADSIKWYRNAALLPDAAGMQLTRDLAKEPFGEITYKARIYKNGWITAAENSLTVYSPDKPSIQKIEVVNEFPHLEESYTQGLEFDGDVLYESTGQFRESDIRITNLKTGEAVKKVDLLPGQFAEGLTILDGKVYQLTWRNRLGMVYDLDLNKQDEFMYNESTEGWGLANDGQYLYKSDGSARIWKIDPNSYEELGYIEVTTNNKRVEQINEMEYIDGKLYCNVYQKNLIMVVNPQNGAVESYILLDDLVKKEPNYDKEDNVLNGIAYHKEDKRLFITGKRWSKIYEIRFL